MGLGLKDLFEGGTLGGIWMILIGMFLHQAAASTYRTVLMRDMLSGVRVSQLMTQQVIVVPDHISLEELVGEYFYRRPHASFPVVSDDRLVGMVSLERLKTVPREEWLRTPVRQVMARADAVRPLAPDDDRPARAHPRASVAGAGDPSRRDLRPGGTGDARLGADRRLL